MSRPLRIVASVLASVVALVLVVTIAGLLLPREHVATSTVTLGAPVDSVWMVVRDFGGMPRWWSEVKSSDRVTTASGERWRQDVGGFQMELDIVEDTPPNRLVTRVVEEPGAPFGGVWTYVFSLAPGGGTTVTITEAGWIGPAPFRVMGRLFGLHTTIDGLLRSLGRRFGQDVTPVHAE